MKPCETHKSKEGPAAFQILRRFKMKKMIALLLAIAMLAAFAGCGKKAEAPAATTEAPTEAPTVPAPVTEAPEADCMTYEEYAAADVDTPVCIETYVQAHQSWWDNKITVYAQSKDGAYFLYNMECSEEQAALLTEGTHIRVNGFKAEWEGEVEIMDATFEILEGTYVAPALDITGTLAAKNLIDSQNQKIAVRDLEVVAADDKGASFLYNWDGSGAAGNNNDLYFNVSDGTGTYTFTVESYLCGEGTDVYNTVTGLKVGDKIDVEGFLYWYNGMQPHVTSVTVK